MCRLSGLVNIAFFCPFTMVYFSIYLCRYLSLTLVGNEFGLCVSGGLETTSLYPAAKIITCRYFQIIRQPPLHKAHVCALHEQCTPVPILLKNCKILIFFLIVSKTGVYFSRGCKSLIRKGNALKY